jgi:uncharacterized membrane protein YphA (DoxX/SURF4 family)
MNPEHAEQRPALRRLLAAVVAVDLIFFLFIFNEDREIATTHGALNAFNDAVSGIGGRALLALVGLAAIVAFGRRAGRIWEGLIALAVLVVLNSAHTQLFGSPWRHLYYSGVCLSGWLLGLAVSRARGAPDDESYARMGSMALLGTTYLSAGLSKMVFGGSDWLSGLPIRAVIVAQDGLVPDGVLSLYRSWVVMTPLVASALSVMTVGFELAGPLMILGGLTRRCVALGLFGMHANIFLLTPILYWQSMVLLLAFGLSADGLSARAETAPMSTPADRRRFLLVAGVLALCAVVAVGHQARRYMRWQVEEQAAARPSPPPVATPPAPWRSQIGPFTAGQALGEGWTIETLEIRDEGFVATLSGAPGRTRFEVTCAASQQQSPFDLGAAHIFYSKESSFDEVSAAGRAIQGIVRTAAAGRDVCSALAEWRAAANQP